MHPASGLKTAGVLPDRDKPEARALQGMIGPVRRSGQKSATKTGWVGHRGGPG